MPAISLDDIGEHAQPVTKKKVSKAKVKAKTTVKKAKTVSKGVKVKKKKKKDPSTDILPSRLDADAMYADIAATQKQKSEEKPKKKKNSVDALKKKKKSTGSLSQDIIALEGELMTVMEEIPDVIKQENEQIQEYMVMFRQCQTMARECEKQYLDKHQSKDIYALMKLYDQMREIIADLRALRDVGQLGEILNEEVLSPFAESAGTILINMFHNINSWNKKNLPVDLIANAQSALQAIVRNSAKDVEQAYQAGLSKTVQIFSASA